MPYKNQADAKACRDRNRHKKNAYMREYSALHRERENARCRQWAKDNPERKKENDKAYFKAHPESNKASVQRYLTKKRAEPSYKEVQAAKMRDWRAGHREQHRATMKAYRDRIKETDENYVIKTRLRARLYKKLRSSGVRKHTSTFDITGCTPDFLRGYIEARFQPGMTWKNIHVDHIIPCAEFDLRDPVQQRQCFHYSNLRPMWPKENMSKRATSPGIHQSELI